MGEQKYYLTNGEKWAGYKKPGKPPMGEAVLTTKQKAYMFLTEEEAQNELLRCSSRFKGLSVVAVEIEEAPKEYWVITDGGAWAAYHDTEKLDDVYVTGDRANAFLFESNNTAEEELDKHPEQFHGLSVISLEDADKLTEKIFCMPKRAGWYLHNGNAWGAYQKVNLKGAFVTGRAELAHAFRTFAKAQSELKRCSNIFQDLTIEYIQTKEKDPVPDEGTLAEGKESENARIKDPDKKERSGITQDISHGFVLTDGTHYASYRNKESMTGAVYTDDLQKAYVFQSEKEAMDKRRKHITRFGRLHPEKMGTMEPKWETPIPLKHGYYLTDGTLWAAYKDKEKHSGAFLSCNGNEAYCCISRAMAEAETKKNKFSGLSVLWIGDGAEPANDDTAQPKQAGYYLTNGQRWGGYRDPDSLREAYSSFNIEGAYRFSNRRHAQSELNIYKGTAFKGLWVMYFPGSEDKGNPEPEEDKTTLDGISDFFGFETPMPSESEEPAPLKGLIQRISDSSCDKAQGSKTGCLRVPWRSKEDSQRRVFTKEERKAIYRKTEGHCYICGEFIDYDAFEVDHFVPLSKGGRNTIDNLWCTCHSCNAVKGNMKPEEFFPHVIKMAKALSAGGVKGSPTDGAYLNIQEP